jgi:hypothetical protein
MKRLEVESFGHIRRAEIEFGDLPVLVGLQASGKSLFVQLCKAVEDEIFGLEHPSGKIQHILASAMTKELKTYFFYRRPRGVITRDISSLDPSNPDEAIAGWGGLSVFSGRIAQIVGEAISEETA